MSSMALYDAAKHGDSEKVKELLTATPDLVFGKDKKGQTPLHWAATYGHKEVAELLVANHAYIDAVDNDGATPLHCAAAEGHKDVVQLLLAHHADVNAKTGQGGTPLHFARNKDVAELLVANHAYIDALDNDGATPLHWAAAYGQKDVAELLVNSNADVSARTSRGDMPYHLASIGRHTDVLQFLLRHRKYDLIDEINAAAYNGNLEKVSALVNDNPNLISGRDNGGMTPLHNAALGRHRNVAEFLLARGADVNATINDGRTPLDIAIRSKDLCDLLVGHGGHTGVWRL